TETPRPVQPVYYAVLYSLFGDNPRGYHLFSYAAEALSGWFLYLSLSRLTGNRFLSIIAASLFVLCPLHDATNNWVGANLVTFSLMLLMVSFWSLLKWYQDGSKLACVGSCTAFLVSAFCYEAFLPLISLMYSAVLFLGMRKQPSVRRLFDSLLYVTPHLAIGGLLVWYQRVLLPKIAPAFLPPLTRGDFKHFVDVMAAGLSVSVGPESWTFVAQRSQEAISAGLGGSDIVRLSLIALTISASVFFLPRTRNAWSLYGAFIVIGLVTVLGSYTVFGVARDYMPALTSLLSRTNAGAAIGVVMLLAGLAGGLLHLCSTVWAGRKNAFDSEALKSAGGGLAASGQNYPALASRRTATALLSFILVIPVAVSWSLANLGLSKAWTLSWQVQETIRKTIAEESSRLKDGDQILLANAPRYVMWAPFFDGVWDFQPMVHMTTGNRKIAAGVVSERLHVKGEFLQDLSSNYECARYDTRGLHLLFPTTGMKTINSSREFVELIEREGTTFGLQKSAITRWKRELEPR
ncbi:MAG: hypothetical protein K2Z81_04875, partial [Cyanobacteria bacterium]|nr:hypothetical protein [Cyanobacteriota bacterium]